jgi:hypothetical protein
MDAISHIYSFYLNLCFAALFPRGFLGLGTFFSSSFGC